MVTIETLQAEVAEHISKANGRPHDPVLKAQSELGQITQSYQNLEAGEFGSPEHHLGNMEHAAAEVVVAMLELCARHELDLDEAVQAVWSKRKLKRWRENPVGPSPDIKNQ